MRAGTKIRFVLTLFVCTWAVAEQPASQRLTLKDAIDLALKNNLSVLVAGTQAGEAAGSTERAFSTLLPHVSGDVLETRQNRNLETAGISLPAIPTVVGPFSFTDFSCLRQSDPGGSPGLSQLEIRRTAGIGGQADLSGRA